MTYESKPRSPWSYASSKRIAEAWAQFGIQQFPNYELFWRLYVEPRTRRAWHLALLPEVPPIERQVARLHTRLIGRLYRQHERSYKEAKTEKQSRLRLCELRTLTRICDDVELFLFLLLFATGELPESHPVYRSYIARCEAHRAAVEEANAPFKGRPLSLDEISSIPRIPFKTILPNETAVPADFYDLSAYTPLATEICRYKEAIGNLSSLSSKYCLPMHNILSPKEVVAAARAKEAAEVAADTPKIQELIKGYDSVGDFITDLSTRLTVEIKNFWGEQVMPLAQKHLKTVQNDPTEAV